jgi:hypothetical protein
VQVIFDHYGDLADTEVAQETIGRWQAWRDRRHGMTRELERGDRRL